MAASIIDALVVTLGLDASDYQKKRKDVSAGLKETREDANKTAKELETQGKRAAGFFSSIKNELLALAGVSLSVAGISSFVRNTTSGLQQMAVQSQALGMSARQLDGWSKAAQAAGSSAEKITGTLGNFQNAIQQYRTMGDASSPIFKALAMLNGDTGVTFDPMKQDADSLLRTALQGLQKELNPDRARQIALMLGVDDATQQRNKEGKFTRDVDRYSKQSGASEENIKIAQRFNQQWTDLQQKLEKTGYVIFNALSPYVDQFTGYLTELAEWMAQHPKEIKAAIKSFFGTISEVVKVCDQAAQAVGGWKNVLLGLIGLKVVSWVLGFAGALKKLIGLSLPSGGAGMLGKAGAAGAVAVAAEPLLDKGLNSLFGENGWFQRVRTADTWGQFGDALLGKGDARWVNGQWVDHRNDPPASEKPKEHPPFPPVKSHKAAAVPPSAAPVPLAPGQTSSLSPDWADSLLTRISGAWESLTGLLQDADLAGDKTQRGLEDLKSGQDDARRDAKRVNDESKGQRNRTNELLSSLLNALIPSAQAEEMSPNITPQTTGEQQGTIQERPAGGARGIRNNNPGNLNFVGQQGATLERPGGRFARFNTPLDGLKAMGRQLMRYFTGKTTGKALDSVRKIISTWAPGSENNTGAYIRHVASSLGVGADTKLNLRDPQVLSTLMSAITQHENSANPYHKDLIAQAAQAATAGIRPGAGMTVDRTPPPPRQVAQSGPQYHIGSVTVQSSAQRVEQLTADISRSAQSRTRAMGFSGGQT